MRSALKKVEEIKETIVITPPNFMQAVIEIEGHDPYKQLRFSQKTKDKMIKTHGEGSRGNKSRKKEPKDFKADYEQATFRMDDGSYGINASCFRNAMISACRAAQFKMTLAKLSLFIEADGYDIYDSTPLVKIYGEPEMVIDHVRNATGVVDLRVRAMWRKWSAKVQITFDGDQFSPTDIANLFMRAGMQVGIGEGRPDSKSSAGTGFGRFKIKNMEAKV